MAATCLVSTGQRFQHDGTNLMLPITYQVPGEIDPPVSTTIVVNVADDATSAAMSKAIIAQIVVVANKRLSDLESETVLKVADIRSFSLGVLESVGDAAMPGDRLVRDTDGNWSLQSSSWSSSRRLHYFEDFGSQWPTDHLIGRLAWDSWQWSGGSVTKVSSVATNVVPYGNSGIARLQSGTTSGGGIMLGYGSKADPIFPGSAGGGMPSTVNMWWKCRTSTVDTNMQAWLGLGPGYGAAADIPDSGHANTAQFLGFSMRAAGSSVNWFGICRDGSGAGNETLVDLSVPADDTHSAIGLRYDGTEVTFWSDDGSGNMIERGTSTTNIPTAADLIIVAGMQTDNTTNKVLDIDLMDYESWHRRF